ncbi:MAG: MbtH domain-containing protein [Candidatus Angelobacter sp. Gp1-AA117]|nr:MAG: MbtH domain-containing protein [Candidatus Angelobacter sp. Gp1-AA117]
MGLNDPDREDTTTYKVVMNHEEQYSIWPDYKENPAGWKDAGKAGPKAECLAYIKEVWTDMRPLSLRKKMEAMEHNPPAPPAAPTSEVKHEKSLVDRLCEGKHEVEVGLRTEKTVARFKKAVDSNYVHIKFTKTKGGTELGFHLDQNSSDFKSADFENGKGTAHLEGNLVLDYVTVKCVADIDLSTLQGTGQLVKVESQQATVA